MSAPHRSFAHPLRVLSAGLCLWLAASAVGAQPEIPASSAKRDVGALEEIELSETRDRRQAARRAKLVELWGDLIQKPPALAELQLHGWRMARLRRLGRLAARANQPALVERITRLQAKEEARHLKQLNRLKHQTEHQPRQALSRATPGSAE